MSAAKPATQSIGTGIPADLASSISDELLNVVALLQAASDAANGPDDPPGSLHSKSTRSNALTWMARDKVVEVVRRMDAYV